MSMYLYFTYPQIQEGQLHLLRAANVSTEKLARVAIRHGLYGFVRRNPDILDAKVMEFADAVSREGVTAVYGGTVKAPKVLADIVESVAAAVYIDVSFNIERLWVIFRGLLEPILTIQDLDKQPQPVTLLHELCGKQGKQVYFKPCRTGAENIYGVYVDGEFVASGSSEHKDMAKLHAAKAALDKLFPSTPMDIDVLKNIDGNDNAVPNTKPLSQEMELVVLAVETILNYRFRNKSLLEEALTHSSFRSSNSYERLEFIGDAILGLALSYYLYLAYPQLHPRQLGSLLSVNVSTEKFARVAIRHGLYGFMRRNGALDMKVRKFADAVSSEHDAVIYGGSVKAPKVLADIVESVAAAIFIDVNFDLERLWVVFRNVLEPIVTLQDLNKQPQPVAKLLQLCQKGGKQVEFRHLQTETTNITSVYVNGEFVASGSSEQKEMAKLGAARAALDKLFPPMLIDVEMLDIDGPFDIEGAKHKLHGMCTKNKWAKPSYKIEKEQGHGHEKRFLCSVQVPTPNGILYMTGEEKTRKKDAENSAASLMIRELQVSNDL